MPEPLKISVIRLKPEDSLADVIELVKKASNDLVFLVFPVENDLVTSLVGLKTLKKKALEAKKAIVASVPGPTYLKLFKDAGIIATTSKDVASIDPSLWNKAVAQVKEYATQSLYDLKGEKALAGVDMADAVETKPASSTPKDLKTIVGSTLRVKQKDVVRASKKPFLALLSLSLLVLFVVLGSVFFVYYKFFPRIEITLVTVGRRIEETLTIVATSKLTGIDLENKRLGLKEQSFTEEESIAKTVTYEVEEGTPATGSIRVYNSSAEEVSIPVGAIFKRTDNGLTYVATSAATIAPGTSVDIPVKATKEGSEYNITTPGFNFDVYLPDGTTKIEGITASNMVAITGGTKTKVKVVTKEEVEQAKKELKELLKDKLKEAIKEYAATNGLYVIGDSITFTEEEFEVDPPIGEKAEEFTVRLVMKAQAYFYEESALKQLVEQMLLDKVSEGNSTLWRLYDLEMKLVSIKWNKAQKEAKITVKVSALATVDIKEDDVWALVKQVKSYKDLYPTLKSKYGEVTEEIDVVFTPAWMPDFLKYIPQERARVTINIITNTR